jgi:ribosomal protein S18 acetylase RimI-like enzyme
VFRGDESRLRAVFPTPRLREKRGGGDSRRGSKKKIARVALRVEKTNVAAVSLYESLGFREDVSRATAHEGYYGAGRHGAVYEYFP